MPSTYTQSLRLEKMADGENNLTWGDKVNNTLDLIDVAMAGVTTKDVSTAGAIITLSVGTGVADEARAPVLVLTGNMTGNVRIVYPPTTKWLIVFNSATSSGGPWSVYISHSAAGGFMIPTGSGSVLYGDGVNFNAAGGGNMVLQGLTTLGAVQAGATLAVSQSATFGASPANLNVSNAGFLNAAGAGRGSSGPVNYSIAAASAVVASTFYATSDARAKSGLLPIDGEAGRTWVMSAKPMRYRLGEEAGRRAGFIAQDQVRAGFAEMVMPMLDGAMQQATDADGLVSPEGVRLNLDYLQTIAYLTAHAQQLEARMAALEARAV